MCFCSIIWSVIGLINDPAQGTIHMPLKKNQQLRATCIVKKKQCNDSDKYKLPWWHPGPIWSRKPFLGVCLWGAYPWKIYRAICGPIWFRKLFEGVYFFRGGRRFLRYVFRFVLFEKNIFKKGNFVYLQGFQISQQDVLFVCYQRNKLSNRFMPRYRGTENIWHMRSTSEFPVEESNIIGIFWVSFWKW